METIQGKTLAAVIIAAVALSGLGAGIATYALFPQVQTQVQTVEKPVYVYVNQTIYQNRTVIQWHNNTVYVQVQPNYQGSDTFLQKGNSTYLYTHIQNLTYQITTNWNDSRVTKLSGYAYNFNYNGTHVLSNFTIAGPPNTLFGVGIILTSREGFWIWLAEGYTDNSGAWTIPLRTISVDQGWSVSISTTINYNK